MSVDYGARLRDLRISKKLSQNQLASLVGTSNQQISFLENNERKLDLNWLERLCKALGVTVPDFFSSQPSSSATDAAGQLDKQAYTLAKSVLDDLIREESWELTFDEYADKLAEIYGLILDMQKENEHPQSTRVALRYLKLVKNG